MVPRRIFSRPLLLIFALALVLALATVLAPIGRAQSDLVRPLSLEQASLVADKAIALQSAPGSAQEPAVAFTDALAQSDDSYVGPDAVSTFFADSVAVSRDELIEAAKSELEYAARLEQTVSSGLPSHDTRGSGTSDFGSPDADVVEALRLNVANNSRRLEELTSLPETYAKEVPLYGVETGGHSIRYTNRTYDYEYNLKDPINVFFYRVGSSADVDFDMRRWTYYRWDDTTCGSTQRVYIWDSGHRGGWDGWKSQDKQMQINNDWWCGSARYHLRIFQGHVRDSDSYGFGVWSMGGAHWDNQYHQSGGYWESAESAVVRSFKDRYNRPLWFVGRIWTSRLNNRGPIGGHYNDGYATFIELIQ